MLCLDKEIDDYIKACGEVYVICCYFSNDPKRTCGFYNGSIRPYSNTWLKCKFYSSKQSAENTAKKQRLPEYKVFSWSELKSGDVYDITKR